MPGPRHLDVSGFADYIRAEVPLEHIIRGTPDLTVFIDPSTPRIGLRTLADLRQPQPKTDRENLEVRTVRMAGQPHTEIFVTKSDLFLDAYLFLCSVADRIQLDGMSVGPALAGAVHAFGQLLERESKLSHDLEVGLFGELRLIRALSRNTAHGIDVEELLNAWRGPDAEEHDLDLRGVDIEVKTTAAERRLHWIGSLTQLMPTVGRPLYLVSQQLTKAAAEDGQTLPQLIDQVRELLGDAPTAARGFETGLLRAGWNDAFVGSCQTRWRLRTLPIAVEVSAGCPRLTPLMLDSVDFPAVAISEVRYRIDLTDWHTDPSAPGFLSEALLEEATS